MLKSYTELSSKSTDIWKVGDEVAISENQKSLMGDAKAVSILQPILIPYHPKDKLEKKIRSFIRLHPVLQVKFNKKEGAVSQEMVSYKDVKVKIVFRNFTDDDKLDLLREEALHFLKGECDFFDGELIRVMAFHNEKKSNELHLVVGVHYALIDMHTNIVLSDHLYKFFFAIPFEVNAVSNFDYVLWQQKFLGSLEGVEKRKFWTNFLGVDQLQKPDPKYLENAQAATFNENISQKLVISGSTYTKMQLLTQASRLPLQAVLLAFHQHLLTTVFKNKKCIQLIRVDGREAVNDTFKVNEVMGMLANSIPLPLVVDSQSKGDFVFKVYTAYCTARMHQQIPFEVIASDFSQLTKEPLEKYIAGLFNFVTINNNAPAPNPDSVLEPLVQKKKNRSSKEYPLNLFVNLFDDSLQIELTCSTRLYEENSYLLQLKELIEREFLSS